MNIYWQVKYNFVSFLFKIIFEEKKNTDFIAKKSKHQSYKLISNSLNPKLRVKCMTVCFNVLV